MDVEIADVEEEPRSGPGGLPFDDPMATPFMLNQKVPLLGELDKLAGPTGLNSGVGMADQNPEVDLSPLAELLIPYADTLEMDELWEFRTLKNEISTIVVASHQMSNIYGEVKNLDDVSPN